MRKKYKNGVKKRGKDNYYFCFNSAIGMDSGIDGGQLMAKKIDDNRLLPCPFCGEEAAIWYFPQHDRPLLKEAYYVGCTNDNCGCELEHPGAFKSLDDAVSAWNRRK